jgi:hypothetical protein
VLAKVDENITVEQTSERVSNSIRVALLSPGVLIIIASIRLLIIANYDPTTAISIESSTGVVSTLLGTIIPVVPALLPVLALSFVALRKTLLLILTAIGTTLVSPAYATPKTAALETGRQFVNLYRVAFMHSSLAARHALSLSWKFDRASIIFGAIAIALIAIDNRELITKSYAIAINAGEDKDPLLAVAFTTVVLLVSGLLIDVFFGAAFFFTSTIYHIPSSSQEISAVTSRPWLPTERITVRPDKVFVGYTLSTAYGWYIFLQQQDRTINYFHSSNVLSRSLCQLNGIARPNRPPIFKLVNAPVSSVPKCFDEPSQQVIGGGRSELSENCSYSLACRGEISMKRRHHVS